MAIYQRGQVWYVGLNRTWTPEELALLGQFTDAEVAKRTGRSLMGVAYKRAQLGRPKRDAILRKWTAEEEALLRKWLWR